MEEGTFEKGDEHNAFRSGYYRGWGPLYRKKCGKDQHNVERLLCLIEDEYTEIISSSLQSFYLCTMWLQWYVGGDLRWIHATFAQQEDQWW